MVVVRFRVHDDTQFPWHGSAPVQREELGGQRLIVCQYLFPPQSLEMRTSLHSPGCPVLEQDFQWVLPLLLISFMT